MYDFRGDVRWTIRHQKLTLEALEALEKAGDVRALEHAAKASRRTAGQWKMTPTVGKALRRSEQQWRQLDRTVGQFGASSSARLNRAVRQAAVGHSARRTNANARPRNASSAAKPGSSEPSGSTLRWPYWLLLH